MALDFNDKKVSVIGAGRSGQAAARLLKSKGAHVFLSEQQQGTKELSGQLAALDIESEFGGNTDRVLDGQLIVTSPGVRTDLPLFQKARAMGTRIISEIELAYLVTPARIVAVTGTNGKSTTASMIGAILAAAGVDARIGGNLAPGRPLAELALDATADSVIVAEVSTFQIETIADFRPQVAVITNITPDHLDRHPDFATYAALKGRLLRNQTASDFAVLNADDGNVRKYTADAAARKLWFSRSEKQLNGAWLSDGTLYLSQQSQDEIVMKATELLVPGAHNVENALAAIAACSVFGAKPAQICQALREFRGVPHRLEQVRIRSGVTYINNSMCTNAAAGVSSLRAFSQPLVVIAGGRDKGLDLSPFLQEITVRARAVVLIGEARGKMAAQLETMGYSHTYKSDSMEDAVRQAALAAQPDDVVILSPCCSSFDMFRDFEDRGEAFKRAVLELD